ncbi:MAG: hypothetical protein GX133_00445 [Syntrophomonadaceae bacterium]|nr:hypothetical protein [Syntrophomonadaceae bacterium]
MMEQLEVVAVRRHQTDNYTRFVLNNGQILNYQQAVEMAYQGLLRNVEASRQNGQQILNTGILIKSYDDLPEMTS